MKTYNVELCVEKAMRAKIFAKDAEGNPITDIVYKTTTDQDVLTKIEPPQVGTNFSLLTFMSRTTGTKTIIVDGINKPVAFQINMNVVQPDINIDVEFEDATNTGEIDIKIVDSHRDFPMDADD